MNKELKHLNKARLIEAVYQLQQQNRELSEENAALKQQLEDRELKISQAGSLAEAVVGLNDIFAKAQLTADQYVEAVRRSYADMEYTCAQKLSEAQAQADAILQEAHATQRQLIDSAAKESEQKWMEVSQRVQDLLSQHEALRDLLQ